MSVRVGRYRVERARDWGNWIVFTPRGNLVMDGSRGWVARRWTSRQAAREWVWKQERRAALKGTRKGKGGNAR